MGKDIYSNFFSCFNFKLMGKVFLMEVISEVSQVKNSHNPALQGGGETRTSVIPVKTSPIPDDILELSSKKENKPQGLGKVAAMLAALSLVVAGGTLGGVKIYDRYFQKLAKSGIKRGEINDALFNFIKKNDPKGHMFYSKPEIMAINEKLTDENFLILKQLSKMKDESPWFIGDPPKRFNLNEITDLLTNTNEFNIKYLEQLAKKAEDIYGTKDTLSSANIIKVLKEISPDNDKVAGQLIDISGVRDTEKLTDCLRGINKDNVDVYQMLLSTRRKGGNTELTIEDMQTVAKQLEKTKNPKCAELFLNAEKNDGTGLYRYSMEDLHNLLKAANEEKVDTYKKLYDLKCTADVERGMVSLVKSVTDDNIDLVEPLLTKTGKGEFLSQYVIFDNWNNIEKILKSVDKENKNCASKLIDIIEEKRYYPNPQRWSGEDVDEYLPELFDELRRNPEKLKRAEKILAEGIVDGNQTLDFQKFYEQYKNINRKSRYQDTFLL